MRGDTHSAGSIPVRFRQGALAAGAFATLFALLFAPFPLRGMLPGNTDTWLVGIALPNTLRAKLVEAFGGGELGSSMHPVASALAFGESAPGNGLLFALFRGLGLDDVGAYFGFLVVAFTASALGVAWLALAFVPSRLAAAFAGLAFACSNFTLANIDSPQTISWGVAATALGFWKRHLDAGRARDAWLAGGLAGAQAYFSAYLFLFQLLAMLVLASARLRALRPRPVLAAGATTLLVALPFFAFYLDASRSYARSWDPLLLAELHSLEPRDLVRPLPGQLLHRYHWPVRAGEHRELGRLLYETGHLEPAEYAGPERATFFGEPPAHDSVRWFVTTRRCAHLGWLLYALAAVALVRSARDRTPLLGLYGLGLLLALGPFVHLFDRLVPMPLLPFAGMGLPDLRVPSRAFFLSVLAVALLASLGLAAILSRLPARWRTPAALAAGVLVLLENVPMPLPAFEGRAFARPEPVYQEQAASLSDAVILELPSRIGAYIAGDDRDLFAWNRECIYMNWQTQHRQSIVNGVNGYFPQSRIEAQHWIDRLPEDEALAALIRLGVDHIAFHRDLLLPGERDLSPALAASPRLEPLLQTERTLLLRVRAP